MLAIMMSVLPMLVEGTFFIIDTYKCSVCTFPTFNVNMRLITYLKTNLCTWYVLVRVHTFVLPEVVTSHL